MIILLALSLASAANLEFVKSAVIAPRELTLDGVSNKIGCEKAGVNPAVRIHGMDGYWYELVCTAKEKSWEYSLTRILKSGAKQRDAKALVFGADKCVRTDSRVWLVDLDGDGEMDMIKRTKILDSETPDCKTMRIKTDDFAAYHWRKDRYVGTVLKSEQKSQYNF